MFCNNRLKSLRTKQKISQTAVAEHLGVTRAAYNSWEKGKYIPNKKNLDELYFLLERLFLCMFPHYRLLHKPIRQNRIQFF